MGLGHHKTEDISNINRFAKNHIVQADGDKAIAGVIQVGRNIGKFINPFEQVSAKQGTLIVHKFWQYKFIVVHLVY